MASWSNGLPTLPPSLSHPRCPGRLSTINTVHRVVTAHSSVHRILQVSLCNCVPLVSLFHNFSFYACTTLEIVEPWVWRIQGHRLQVSLTLGSPSTTPSSESTETAPDMATDILTRMYIRAPCGAVSIGKEFQGTKGPGTKERVTRLPVSSGISYPLMVIWPGPRGTTS